MPPTCLYLIVARNVLVKLQTLSQMCAYKIRFLVTSPAPGAPQDIGVRYVSGVSEASLENRAPMVMKFVQGAVATIILICATRLTGIAVIVVLIQLVDIVTFVYMVGMVTRKIKLVIVSNVNIINFMQFFHI